MSERVSAPSNGQVVDTRSKPDRLACTGVTVRFGGLTAVRDVDLTVGDATIVGLVGPNGAGKSTLFGVLSGLLTPSTGRVFLHGEDVTELRPQARAARGLARTFQHPQLFSGLTVRQHLALAHRVRHTRSRVWSDLFTLGALKKVDSTEADKIDELVELVGLGSLIDRPATGLPLGSARLVELGRALATSPSVLLLDEPSSGLDTRESEQFEATLRRVAFEQGVSILLVEHDVEMVMRLCSTVNVLDFGALIASGSPEVVRADPAVRAAYLGEAISAGPAEPDADTALADVSVTEGEMAHVVDITGHVNATEELVVENLAVTYGDALALSDVSLRVNPGEVLAVLGPNGAGKSSLARALSGLVPSATGRMMLGDRDMTEWSADRIRHAGIVHLPEGRGVFRSMSVMDNLRMATSTIPKAARAAALDVALDTFPVLADRRRQLAGSLSGGEQQMLSLARALAAVPTLIIADEMSLGLAPKMVDLVFDGLSRARQAGISIIIIEQYVHRALAFADHCLVLQRGSVAWHGPAKSAGGEVLSRYLGEAMTAAS